MVKRKKRRVIPTTIQERIMTREKKNLDPMEYAIHPKRDGLTVYKVELKTGKIEEI